MATDWVKSGLDAYLSLTSADQAEKKAADDKIYKQQTMQLLQNQDQRAGTAAGLTNQLTQQQITKGAQEAAGVDWYRNLFDEGVAKEEANPMTPTAETINDPKIVDMSKYVYGNSLKTAAYLKELPQASFSIPFNQIGEQVPFYVQDTAKQMFVPAAAKRAGQEAVDPSTGIKGILTGNMGHINIEKDPSGETYISGDMEVKNPDGSIRYAPFTDGTDNPNSIIKRMPVSVMEHEANSTLLGIDDAQRTGADPAVTITHRKISSLANAPPEVLKAEYESLRKHKENLRTRESDVETTKKVGKTLESMKSQIDALSWEDDPHTAAADLYTTLSQSGMTTPEVEKAVTRIAAAKVPADKNLQIEEIGAGGNNVRKVIVSKDGTTTPIGNTYQKHQTPAASTDKELLLVKRDVATRLREAQRAHQAAIKSGNSDTIAESVDYIESLNADAKTYGVAPLPVPKRPMTSDEETALYDQATTNVKSQRGFVAKQFNLDPNKQDVETEFQRLKQAKPKTARPTGADMSPGDTLHTKQPKQQPRQQATSQNQGTSLNGAPPAAQNNGRIIKDTASGKRYQSNGASWREVQ